MTKKQKMQYELQCFFDEQCSIENELYEELDSAMEYYHYISSLLDCRHRANYTREYREAKAKVEAIVAAIEDLDEKW